MDHTADKKKKEGTIHKTIKRWSVKQVGLSQLESWCRRNETPLGKHTCCREDARDSRILLKQCHALHLRELADDALLQQAMAPRDVLDRH